MRPVQICATLLVFATVLSARSGSADVTVIFDIKGPYSEAAIREMRNEASRIIQTSGIHLDWLPRIEAGHAVFSDLVVMTFKGSCTFDPAPPSYDESGPYAITHTANGEVQPFGEVDCDRVVNSVRTVMFGVDFARADLLIGRALGRVVAHELVHMLTRSGQHAREGVQKQALTARQLISASLPLSALDVDRLRVERGLGH